MPSTNIQFAWALPVKVEVLGAHLEAYRDLLPAFYTLRLCNRYGKGPKAHVTKLPVEMINLVEEFLTSAKRAVTLPQWVDDFRCWEDRCDPIDHMSDAVILDIYNDSKRQITPGSFDNDEEYEDALEPDYEVTPWIKECVAQRIANWSDDGESDSCVGRMRWCDRVGQAGVARRGSFDQLGIMLKKDFGLQVWISHVQIDHPPCNRDDNVSHSTIAYLRFPDATSAEHAHTTELSNVSFDMIPEKSEAGMAVTHKVPATPSAKSLARFDHALKALDLEITETDEARRAAGERTKPFPFGKVAVKKTDPKSVKVPQLTMFVRSEDKPEW